MTVAIIGGSGHLGYGLALRLAAAGQDVIIGSRDAEKARTAAAEATAAAGRTVRGTDNRAAATEAEIVILAVPAEAQAATIAGIREAVRGKVVVDTTVSLAPGDPTRTALPAAGCAAQVVAQLLGPEVRVTAAFQTMSGKLLAQLDKPLEGDVLIVGDDKEAKQAVAGLVEAIGCRAMDGGPLENGATLERLTALIIGMNMRYKRRHIGLRFTGV